MLGATIVVLGESHVFPWFWTTCFYLLPVLSPYLYMSDGISASVSLFWWHTCENSPPAPPQSDSYSHGWGCEVYLPPYGVVSSSLCLPGLDQLGQALLGLPPSPLPICLTPAGGCVLFLSNLFLWINSLLGFWRTCQLCNGCNAQRSTIFWKVM